MSDYKKERLYIICLHGIGGDRDIFGDFENAITTYATKYTPHIEPIVIFFDYDTGSDNKSTTDFSKDLNTYLDDYFCKTPLKDTDKISLVMHSQGGLVGTLWLWETLRENRSYLNHVDAFIAIAVPFWGSKIAEIWSEIRKGWDFTGKKFPIPAGKKELQEMAFSSDSIFKFREFFIAPELEIFRSSIHSKIRPLNIAAYSKFLGGLNYVIGEPGILEGDNAVALPCARADFLYQRSLLTDYSDGNKTTLDQLSRTELSPYIIVNAVHHTITPNFDKLPGVIQIPKGCSGNKDCGHPSFKFIAAHLFGQEFPEADSDITKGLTLCSLDLNIRISEEEIKQSQISLKFKLIDGTEIKRSELSLGLPITGWPQHKKHSTKYGNHYRYQYFGDIETGGDEYDLCLHLSVPGYRTRLVEFTLKVAHSTYIDVNLIKI